MKAWLISSSLLLQSFGTFASESPAIIDTIKTNWSYSELATFKNGESTVNKKTFIRYINIGLMEIPIAQTQYVYLKNPQEKTDLKIISKKIAKSFGTSKITSYSNENSALIEGDWDKINRHVKIQFQLKGKNDVVILTSFSRIGFNKWLLPEINGLHHLLENAQTTSTKTSFQMFLENVGIRKVHAQGNSGINLGSFLSGGNITTGGGSGNNPVFAISTMSHLV